MRPLAVGVAHELLQDRAQVLLVQDDQAVQALPPLGAGPRVCDTAAVPSPHPGEPAMSTAAAGADRVAVERWAGEVRVNLVRLIALIAFYACHVLRRVYRCSGPSVRSR